MHEFEHGGFFPFTPGDVILHAPSAPGICVLVVRLGNGIYEMIQAERTNDVYSTLWSKLQHPSALSSPQPPELPGRSRWYFTYFLIPGTGHSTGAEKILTQTSDPVTKLRIITSN